MLTGRSGGGGAVNWLQSPSGFDTFKAVSLGGHQSASHPRRWYVYSSCSITFPFALLHSISQFLPLTLPPLAHYYNHFHRYQVIIYARRLRLVDPVVFTPNRVKIIEKVCVTYHRRSASCYWRTEGSGSTASCSFRKTVLERLG